MKGTLVPTHVLTEVWISLKTSIKFPRLLLSREKASLSPACPSKVVPCMSGSHLVNRLRIFSITLSSPSKMVSKLRQQLLKYEQKEASWNGNDVESFLQLASRQSCRKAPEVVRVALSHCLSVLSMFKPSIPGLSHHLSSVFTYPFSRFNLLLVWGLLSSTRCIFFYTVTGTL